MKHRVGEVWSRRVNKGDRFIYHIDGKNKKILVTQSLGHYEDKKFKDFL